MSLKYTCIQEKLTVYGALCQDQQFRLCFRPGYVSIKFSNFTKVLSFRMLTGFVQKKSPKQNFGLVNLQYTKEKVCKKVSLQTSSVFLFLLYKAYNIYTIVIVSYQLRVRTTNRDWPIRTKQPNNIKKAITNKAYQNNSCSIPRKCPIHQKSLF